MIDHDKSGDIAGYLRWIAIFIFLAAIYVARPVLIPFFCALFLAVLLDPLTVFFERLSIPRSAAAVAAFILFLGPAFTGGWITYRAVSGVIVELPTYTHKLQALGDRLQTRLDEVQSSLQGLEPRSTIDPEKSVQKVEVVDSGSRWASYAMAGAGSVFQWLSVAFFVPLLLLYFLIDKENLRESFHAVAGKHVSLIQINRDIPLMVRAFFIGNFTAGLVLSIAQGLVFWIAGMKDPWSLGLITGFLNLIPLLGSPIAALLPIIQIVGSTGSAGTILAVGGSIFVLHWVVGNILLPQIVGPRINVSAAAMLFGLMFWGWIWGGFGFLFAIPLTALIKITLEANPRTFHLANLLAARPRHITD